MAYNYEGKNLFGGFFLFENERKALNDLAIVTNENDLLKFSGTVTLCEAGASIWPLLAYLRGFQAV